MPSSLFMMSIDCPAFSSLPPGAAGPIRVLTLDLDDTLWPVGPTLVRAEQVLGTVVPLF